MGRGNEDLVRTDLVAVGEELRAIVNAHPLTNFA
jgi:hypothetical protein